MYGKLPERKFNQQDLQLDCQVLRSQLGEYLDEQNKRVNVDSAKKKAVLQRFDYEGFRQMVLGANLFSLKTSELIRFSQGKESTFQAQLKSTDTRSKVPQIQNKQILQQLLQRSLKSELACKSFSEFRKWVDKWYCDPLNDQAADGLLHLVKSQQIHNLQKVFNCEFDNAYLFKLILLFRYVLDRVQESNRAETCFILSFLGQICSLKKMKVGLGLLLPKERREIGQLCKRLQSKLQGEGKQQLSLVMKMMC